MADFWCYASGDKLVFGYRARRFDVTPPPYMNATELTAVSASAYDESGSPIVIAQQPSYVASLKGYIGWILAADLLGKRFSTLVLNPTLGLGIVAAWAPAKTIDVRINQNISIALAVIQARLGTIPPQGGEIDFPGVLPVPH